MVSDEHYEICLPILQDPSLDDEDKTDKIEELLRKETNLSGPSLENVILDALWRHRDGGTHSSSPPPIRQTILRRPSPASWRGSSSTPLSGSPRLGISPLAPPGFGRSKTSSSAGAAGTVGAASAGGAVATNLSPSPFSSPRPSPRLALAQPIPIPHSPNLNAYEFAMDTTPAPEIIGDYQIENVDWLVGGDDAPALSSSAGASSTLNAAAPEFSMSNSGLLSMGLGVSMGIASAAAAQQADMTPYDMLRSILGQSHTDEEIEAALAMNGYDLGATVASMMEHLDGQNSHGDGQPEESKAILVGKSMAMDTRPATPVGQQKSSVICKFYLSTGQCLRADCRFSHDLSNHLCKYWVMGSCLAGNSCIFSHDPAQLISKLVVDGSQTPPSKPAALALHDYGLFPSLQPGTPEHLSSHANNPTLSLTPPGLKPFHGTDLSRPRSRPGSRHQTREAAPALDDTEAFPSLGSGLKLGKKHHGKRGGHGHREASGPNSLADVVKMSPAASSNVSLRPGSRAMSRNGSSTGSRGGENSPAAMAIPGPGHIPWLETGDRANRAYLRARQEAVKHCGLRNKFLQSAAQAWSRNDARAAKALSLRGQSENDHMRKAHREAARELYGERNRHMADHGSSEIYVDLHGLHPEEAVAYLEQVLLENEKESRPVYAIAGTGHHSKNGKDKVGKAVRGFLVEWRYAFREFSVPGDRNNMGGILGIDARSWDRSLNRDAGVGAGAGGGTAADDAIGDVAVAASRAVEAVEAVEAGGVLLSSPGEEGADVVGRALEIGDGKVRLLVRDPPKGPSGSRSR